MRYVGKSKEGLLFGLGALHCQEQLWVVPDGLDVRDGQVRKLGLQLLQEVLDSREVGCLSLGPGR
jgi:hypothetical protein